MGERDQRIELAVAAKIDLLKDYIREFAAGKKDLENTRPASTASSARSSNASAI